MRGRLWAPAAACVLSLTALAQEPATAVADAQEIVVTVSVNGRPHGERIGWLTRDGRVLLPLAELETMFRVAADAPRVVFGGAPHVPVDALPGAIARFDERNLALELTLPPEVFDRQVYSAASAPPPASEEGTAPGSALLNYRVGYAGDDAGREQWTVAAEEAVTLGGWLARNQTYHQVGPDAPSAVRYETQLVHDDRAGLRRLTLGDAFTTALDLSGSAQIAGVRLARAYQLSPYFLRQPTAGFTGMATLPSEVELYVGEARLLRQAVAPGPFEIGDVSYYGGRRDVRVVVRDMLGREQTFAYPFYFADQGLARGLHDYAYQAGWLRQRPEQEALAYGVPAFAGFHRYGASDAWTLGARAEGSSDFAGGGPLLHYRSDRTGVISAAAAGSRSWATGRSGTAESLAHSFQAGGFSTLLAARWVSRHYEVLHSGAGVALPRRELSASVSQAFARAVTLTAGFRRAERAGLAPLRAATLGASTILGSRFNLLATVQRDFALGEDAFALTLLFAPPGGGSASVGGSRDTSGTGTTAVQAGNAVPTGEGPSYRLAAQHTDDPVAPTSLVAPELRYHGRNGVLTGELRAMETAGERSTAYAASLAGAFAAVNGRVGVSRPVPDSFGVAEIEPPLPGVRVYQNSQEIGRTGTDGRLFLPTLTSFITSEIAINDRDVPIEYAIDRTARRVSPGFHGGTLVRFALSRTQGFAGSLHTAASGEVRALEYHEVTLDAEGAPVTFLTGRDGDFYFENLPPGEYRASVRRAETSCEFALTLPASDEPVVALGEVMACRDGR